MKLQQHAQKKVMESKEIQTRNERDSASKTQQSCVSLRNSSSKPKAKPTQNIIEGGGQLHKSANIQFGYKSFKGKMDCSLS
jgi:hypothetical protein